MTSKQYYKNVALGLVVFSAIVLNIISFCYAQGSSKIKDLDIISGILESMKQGELTEEKLLSYFESNEKLLENNILF